MDTFTEKLKSESILKRLKDKYKLDNVKYNILTSNFIYIKDGDKKQHISLKSLVNLMENEDKNKRDEELYQLLNKLEASYFDERLKKYFINFYSEIGEKLPRDIFIENGTIVIPYHNNILCIGYYDDFDRMFDYLKKIIEGVQKIENDEVNIGEIQEWQGENSFFDNLHQSILFHHLQNIGISIDNKIYRKYGTLFIKDNDKYIFCLANEAYFKNEISTEFLHRKEKYE